MGLLWVRFIGTTSGFDRLPVGSEFVFDSVGLLKTLDLVDFEGLLNPLIPEAKRFGRLQILRGSSSFKSLFLSISTETLVKNNTIKRLSRRQRE